MDIILTVPPVAEDDSFTIFEDPEMGTTELGEITNGNLLAANGDDGVADSDVNNDPLTVTQINGEDITNGEQITLASGALLTIRTNGTFDYDPNGAFDSLSDDEQGTETFTYTLSDGTAADTDTATVTITVNGNNDVPTIDLNGPDVDGTDSEGEFAEDSVGLPLANLLSIDAVVQDDEDNIAEIRIIPRLPEINDGDDEFLIINTNEINFSLRLSDGDINAELPLVFGETTFNVAYDDGAIVITNADEGTFESDDLEGFLRLIAYENRSQDSVNDAPRIFEFQITDPGSVTIAQSTISINRLNDAPVPVVLSAVDELSLIHI